MPAPRAAHLFALSWHWRNKTPKLFQNLAKSRAVKRDETSRLHSVIRLFGYSVISLLPSSLLHAETGSAIVTGGGEVKFENAETNWVKNAEGGLDLILRFTEGGSYTLPGVSQVRLLAVGGGGGGGGS